MKKEVASAVLETIRVLENLFNLHIEKPSSFNRNSGSWMRPHGGEEYIRHAFQTWLKQR